MMFIQILIIVIIVIMYSELGRTIGSRNFIIGKLTRKIKCFFLLKGKYDSKKMLKILDSYEIFDYRLFGTRLVKTMRKSYDIEGHGNEKALLSIRAEQHSDNYTLNVMFNHELFDMQYIMEIIDGYLRDDFSHKPLMINKAFYGSDVNLNILMLWNYFKRVNVEREKITVKKEEIKTLQVDNLSSLDIVFAILANKYLGNTGKTKCILSIIKSQRGPNDRYRVGNMVTFHTVEIRPGTTTDIAKQIRQSYSKRAIFVPADIVITSWVPHKGHAALHSAIQSNGKNEDNNFQPMLYHRLYQQQITVSLDYENYLCDIHRSKNIT